jgi:hypothetical protein
MAIKPALYEKGVLTVRGLMLNKTSAIATGRIAQGLVLLKVNSTSATLMVNTTGTTWMYLNMTSVFPTK